MSYYESGQRRISCTETREEVFELTLCDDGDFPDSAPCNDIFTVGTIPSSGGADEIRAFFYANSILPSTRVFNGGLCNDVIYLHGFTVEEIGCTGTYKVVATYKDGRSPKQATYCTLSFTAGGQTVNQKVARAHVGDAFCSLPIDPQDVACVASGGYGGLINVDGEGPQGVDVPTNGLNFSLTQCFPPNLVTCEYVQRLYYMAPCMNAFPFLDCFASGEILFTGAQGSGNRGQLFCITFDFQAQPNWYGGPPGCIPSSCLSQIFKLGWDYVWFDYRPVLSASCGHVIRPKMAHIERLFCLCDLAALNFVC